VTVEALKAIEAIKDEHNRAETLSAFRMQLCADEALLKMSYQLADKLTDPLCKTLAKDNVGNLLLSVQQHVSPEYSDMWQCLSVCALAHDVQVSTQSHFRLSCDRKRAVLGQRQAIGQDCSTRSDANGLSLR
jgi:hypothetical protein